MAAARTFSLDKAFCVPLDIIFCLYIYTNTNSCTLGTLITYCRGLRVCVCFCFVINVGYIKQFPTEYQSSM